MCSAIFATWRSAECGEHNAPARLVLCLRGGRIGRRGEEFSNAQHTQSRRASFRKALGALKPVEALLISARYMVGIIVAGQIKGRKKAPLWGPVRYMGEQ